MKTDNAKDDAVSAERGVSSRVIFKNDLVSARTATKVLRAFLAEQGLAETELFHCEVCLAEACNNAVRYATGGGEANSAEAVFRGGSIELRVTDHTGGFELRERATAIDPRRESGRGLYIIQSLMNEVRYDRGAEQNTLVMRKTRTRQRHHSESRAAAGSIESTRRQLESCRATITGMARELCLRSETLAAVFRCSTELGRTHDLEGFGKRISGDLLHLTSADWFILRLADEERRLAVIAASDPRFAHGPIPLAGEESGPAEGPQLSSPPSFELHAARSHRVVEFDPDDRAIRPDDPLYGAGRDAAGLVQPVLFGDELVGTLAIGRRFGGCFSALEAETIRTFAEFMAVQVVDARQQESQVRARIVEHELEIARRIQRALLPRCLPELPGFSLAANWESARQVGGDFYDAHVIDPHTILLGVADVMGKGVPAAMFATITRSLLRALVARTHRPADLLGRLNELLYEELSAVGMFVTVQLVAVDLRRRRIVAANAGHCPVLVATGKSVRSLHVAGTPLGILPKASYRETTAELPPPAGLLLYTDGVTETLNPGGDMFGYGRLARLLRHRFVRAPDAGALRDELASEIAGFRGSEPLHDDQAFVVLHERSVSRTNPRSPSRTTGEFIADAARREFIFPSVPTLPTFP